MQRRPNAKKAAHYTSRGASRRTYYFVPKELPTKSYPKILPRVTPKLPQTTAKRPHQQNRGAALRAAQPSVFAGRFAVVCVNFGVALGRIMGYFINHILWRTSDVCDGHELFGFSLRPPLENNVKKTKMISKISMFSKKSKKSFHQQRPAGPLPSFSYSFC